MKMLLPVIIGLLGFQPTWASVFPINSPQQNQKISEYIESKKADSVFKTQGNQTIKKYISNLAGDRLSTSQDNEHVLFKDSDDAATWFKQVEPRFAAALGVETIDLVPSDDSRYELLQGYINEVWEGYVQLFPNETANLNVPPVLLIESEMANAFVPAYILESDKIAHTVVILSGILDSMGAEENGDMISGLIGHELAHSVFKHLLPTYAEQVNRFYNINNHSLGFLADRDDQLDNDLNTWVGFASMVGDLAIPELNNLPSKGIGNPALYRVWMQIVSDMLDDSEACGKVVLSYQVWDSYQLLSTLTSSFYYDLNEVLSIQSSSERLATDLIACQNGREVDFYEAFSKSFGIEKSVLAEIPEIADMAVIFDSSENAIVGTQNLVKPMREEMIKIEKNYDFNDLNFFTYEEHADDVSLIVNKFIGKDPTGLANMFGTMMSPKDKQECDSLIAEDHEPKTGSFSDPHRSSCFRIYHLHKLNEYVEQSGLSNSAFAEDYIKTTIYSKAPVPSLN